MDHIRSLVYLFTFLQIYTHVSSEIRNSVLVNKLAKASPTEPQKSLEAAKSTTRQHKVSAKSHHLKAAPKTGKPPATLKKALEQKKTSSKLANVKPVGEHRAFVPLTEIPPLKRLAAHLAEDKRNGRRHMEDCSPEPDWHEVEGGPSVHIQGEYYDDSYAATARTVRIPMHIDHLHFDVTQQVPYYTVGTIEGIGFHPTTEITNSCEKIYQDHLNENYSEESADLSEESMEVARMPLFPPHNLEKQEDYSLYDMYEKNKYSGRCDPITEIVNVFYRVIKKGPIQKVACIDEKSGPLQFDRTFLIYPM